MNLFLVHRTDIVRYDQFVSFVVASENSKKAKAYIPTFKGLKGNPDPSTWTTKENIKVKLIGSTDKFKEGDIVIASFNAG